MNHLPPEALEHDLPSASVEALLSLLEPGPARLLDAADFLAGLRSEIREHGATYNQRMLLRRAWQRATEAQHLHMQGKGHEPLANASE